MKFEAKGVGRHINQVRQEPITTEYLSERTHTTHRTMEHDMVHKLFVYFNNNVQRTKN